MRNLKKKYDLFCCQDTRKCVSGISHWDEELYLSRNLIQCVKKVYNLDPNALDTFSWQNSQPADDLDGGGGDDDDGRGRGQRGRGTSCQSATATWEQLRSSLGPHVSIGPPWVAARSAFPPSSAAGGQGAQVNSVQGCVQMHVECSQSNALIILGDLVNQRWHH